MRFHASWSGPVLVVLLTLTAACGGKGQGAGSEGGGAGPAVSAADVKPGPLTAREQQLFHHLAEGSELIPLSWVRAVCAIRTTDRSCEVLEAEGKRVLVVVWDNAAWHVSREVRTWIKEHNRAVKQSGKGVRILVCRLPTRSPWLNAIEPRWVHGKKQVVEPTRKLSATELKQRVCRYYGCDLLDPLAKPVA